MLKKFLKITIVALGVILIPICTVHAQELPQDSILELKPSILSIDIDPGTTKTFNMSFINHSEFDFIVEVEIMDYRHPVQTELATLLSAQAFISLPHSSFIAERNMDNNVEITITTPTQISAGSYFAMVVFQPLLPPEYFELYSTHVVPQIAGVLAVNVNTQETSTLTDFLEITNFANNQRQKRIDFYTTYQNNDVFYHQIKGNIFVENILGATKETILIPDKNILPAHQQSEILSVEKKLYGGFYKAVIIVGDENFSVQKHIWFFVWPPLSFYLIVFMVCIIGFTIYWKRTPIVSALKIIFSRRKFNSYNVDMPNSL